MRIFNLNSIAESVKSGQLSRVDGIKQLSEFVLYNKPLFGLQKFDEDFTSNLIVRMLEKGEKLFDSFDESQGSFFNFFYSYIKNLIHTERRKLIRESQIEKYTTDQIIADYGQFTDLYQTSTNTFYSVAEKKQVYETPSASNDSSKYSSDIKKPYIHFNKLSTAKKTILILTLKFSYYITDTHIKNISQFCKISLQDCFEVVQTIKSRVIKKEGKIKKLIEKRNKTFYNNSKLQNLLLDTEQNKEKKLQLAGKIAYEKSKLENYNERLLDSKSLLIKPTNRDIADFLPLCERQIGYYMKRAEKLLEERPDVFLNSINGKSNIAE